MQRTTRQLMMALLLGVLALPMASCTNNIKKSSALAVDSFMTPERPTLRESEFNLESETAKLDRQTLRDIGKSYAHNGEGPVSVVVGYDPSSHTNTASHATTEAKRIADVLGKNGIRDVKTDILPDAVKGSASTTVVSFKSLIAQGPQGCHAMGGLDGRQVEADPDEPMGCTTEMLMARQIAHPQDLEGRAGLDDGSGRRQAGVLDTYQKGTPNPALTNVQTASGSSQ